MTVTGMDLSKPAISLHGQSSNIASNTGTKPALDFAALISMLSNGESYSLVNAEGAETSLNGDMSIPTEELVKKMLSSVILSDESISQLSESELDKLSENKNLTEFAESFLGLLSQKPVVNGSHLPAIEYVHLQNYGNVDESNYGNVDDSYEKFHFSMTDDPSLISSGSNLLLHLLMRDLEQAKDVDPAGNIQNTGPVVVDKIWNTSVLNNTNTKILSINYESVIKELSVNKDNVAHFVKLYSANSKFLDNSSDSHREPNILNLKVNAKFSNDTDVLETKVNVTNEKATSFRPENFERVFNRGEENKPIILNIKDVDAVVAQFKLELDGQSSLLPERINDLEILLHQGELSAQEVEELSLTVVKARKTLPQLDKFVDYDHAVIFERSILQKRSSLQKEISEPTTDSYVTLKFVKNDLTLSNDGGKKVDFTKLDQLGSISDDFLQKLSDVQSGKFGAKYMNETLSSELVHHNPENLNLDQLKTPITNFLFKLKEKPSVNLKISTADILSYRNIITKPSNYRLNINASNEKILLPESDGKIISADSNERIFLPDNLERPFEQNIKFGAPKFGRTLEAYLPNTNFVNLNDSGASLNRVMPTQLLSGAIVNSLSLYDAQYSSRLGMLLTDNIIKGQENFEIQLEPETFGKVRVSVSMENANLEVKMLAENSAAITALRSSEAILQSITEQNGLKLSDYSVDMQNNASNGGKQGNNEKDNNLPDSSRYGDKEVTSDDILTNSETSNSLNLLA